MLSIYDVAVGHLYVFFGEMFIQVFCSFFNQVVWLILSCMSYLYILDRKPLSVISFENIFTPFSGLSFHFVSDFLCFAKAFKINLVSFVYFCFCFLCLRRQVQKYLAMIYVRVFCLCFLLGVLWLCSYI